MAGHGRGKHCSCFPESAVSLLHRKLEIHNMCPLIQSFCHLHGAKAGFRKNLQKATQGLHIQEKLIRILIPAFHRARSHHALRIRDFRKRFSLRRTWAQAFQSRAVAGIGFNGQLELLVRLRAAGQRHIRMLPVNGACALPVDMDKLFRTEPRAKNQPLSG